MSIALRHVTGGKFMAEENLSVFEGTDWLGLFREMIDADPIDATYRRRFPPAFGLLPHERLI